MGNIKNFASYLKSNTNFKLLKICNYFKLFTCFFFDFKKGCKQLGWKRE